MQRSILSAKSALLVLAAALALGAGADPTAANDGEAEGTSARVWGVQVIKAPIGEGDDALKPQGWYSFGQHGTALAIRVDHPAGGLLELDKQATEIASLTDDEGTNLLEGDFKYAEPGEPQSVKVNEAGDTALLEIRGPKTPASDATSLALEGELAFRAAEGTRTHEAASPKLAKGETIEAGPIPFSITGVEAIDRRDWKGRIKLKAEESTSALKAMVFRDADGAVIESTRRRRISSSMGSMTRVQTWYDLKAPVEQVEKIELEYWKGLHTVEVSIDLETSLGL